MSKKEENKKHDIFKLFKREKEISLEDDNKLSVKILMIKLSEGENRKALTEYIDSFANIKNEMNKKDKETGYYTNTVDLYDKVQIITGIINYEKARRDNITDLYPIENEETLSPKVLEEKQNELLGKWEKERKEILEKKEDDELKNILKEMTIEGLATIDAGRIFDYKCLQLMCRELTTRTYIFHSIDEVESLDSEILKKLLEELHNFRQLDNMKDTRELADDESFLVSGESQKSLDDSQPITT